MDERQWTGNASGSYTFNTYQAEENLCHNLDLLKDALDAFGVNGDHLFEKGAEAADVAIRCYVLPNAIGDAMQEIEPDFNAAHKEMEADIETETADFTQEM